MKNMQIIEKQQEFTKEILSVGMKRREEIKMKKIF